MTEMRDAVAFMWPFLLFSSAEPATAIAGVQSLPLSFVGVHVIRNE